MVMFHSFFYVYQRVYFTSPSILPLSIRWKAIVSLQKTKTKPVSHWFFQSFFHFSDIDELQVIHSLSMFKLHSYIYIIYIHIDFIFFHPNADSRDILLSFSMTWFPLIPTEIFSRPFRPLTPSPCEAAAFVPGAWPPFRCGEAWQAGNRRIEGPRIRTGNHYCWWKKSCTTLDGWNPINNGINHLSTGAGFLPSTVVPSGNLTVCYWKWP